VPSHRDKNILTNVSQKIKMKYKIESAIKKVLKDLKLPQVKFSVEHPENMAFGDYSTNVGIITHKTKEIIARLKTEPTLKKMITEITTAGPGFINISIQPEQIINQTKQVIKGKFSTQWSEKKVSVEYTDPNPFKEFHIGHLYSNLIGESIAKIFEAAGATVWRGNFYGDAGMHISKSVWGMMQKMTKEKVTLEDLEKLSIKDRQKFMGQGYALGVNKYDGDKKIQEEIKDINYMVYVAAQEELVRTKNWQPIVNYKKFIEGHQDQYPKIKEVYTAGLRWSLEYFETYYKRVGTKFDGYYPESWVGEYGVKMVEKGLKMGVLEKSEGAVVFKGEKYGLHTRVFLNKLGLPTYEAKDLGLARAKYEDFKYDYSLNVFGKEIDEYYYVVKKAMELIEPELGKKANHLAHGMVKLPEGKMSSRSGNVITVEWLLNEAKHLIQKNFKCCDEIGEMVGQGAVKYALLKSGIGQDVVFDFDKSISFEGNSGPYLQYSYARARSVLEKSGRNRSYRFTEVKELNSEEDILLRTLYRFEEVVAQAADELAPNLIANFIYDVAQKFNSFYNKHRIVGNDFRLWLTLATAEILKRGLNLLGIAAPEKM
jgi:arginyl-tRNA synthetase